MRTCARSCSADLAAFEADDGLPIKPQKAIADLRRALGPEDIVVSDVGAHKIWVARLYQAYEPNTVIISNGFASMGISLPGRDRRGAGAPRPARRGPVRRRRLPDERPGAGDGEAAGRARHGRVWRDDGYGLIDWKQRNEFGRPFGVDFGNPDFVALPSPSASPASVRLGRDLYPR